GEMRLLHESMAIGLEEDVFHPGGGTAVKGRLDERADDVPDLGPALARRLAKRFWVLRSQHRAIGVVIELAELGPPPQQQREAIGEQEARHHAQARRPLLDRTERRLRPVEGAHQGAHLAAARKAGSARIVQHRLLDHPYRSTAHLKYPPPALAHNSPEGQPALQKGANIRRDRLNRSEVGKFPLPWGDRMARLPDEALSRTSGPQPASPLNAPPAPALSGLQRCASAGPAASR